MYGFLKSDDARLKCPKHSGDDGFPIVEHVTNIENTRIVEQTCTNMFKKENEASLAAFAFYSYVSKSIFN